MEFQTTTTTTTARWIWSKSKTLHLFIYQKKNNNNKYKNKKIRDLLKISRGIFFFNNSLGWRKIKFVVNTN